MGQILWQLAYTCGNDVPQTKIRPDSNFNACYSCVVGKKLYSTIFHRPAQLWHQAAKETLSRQPSWGNRAVIRRLAAPSSWHWRHIPTASASEVACSRAESAGTLGQRWTCRAGRTAAGHRGVPTDCAVHSRLSCSLGLGHSRVLLAAECTVAPTVLRHTHHTPWQRALHGHQ